MLFNGELTYFMTYLMKNKIVEHMKICMTVEIDRVGMPKKHFTKLTIPTNSSIIFHLSNCLKILRLTDETLYNPEVQIYKFLSFSKRLKYSKTSIIAK